MTLRERGLSLWHFEMFIINEKMIKIKNKKRQSNWKSLYKYFIIKISIYSQVLIKAQHMQNL